MIFSPGVVESINEGVGDYTISVTGEAMELWCTDFTAGKTG